MQYKQWAAVIGLSAGLFSAAHTTSGSQNVVVPASRVSAYDVTVTNLTRSQVLSPLLVVTHSADLSLYQLGAPASNELALLAEDGDNSALALAVGGSPGVLDVQSGAGVLPPGASETITVLGNSSRSHLSVLGMLVNTNDAFAALDSFPLPARGAATTFAIGLDAGSEFNSESCTTIPGPACNGLGAGVRDPVGAEGFVYVSNGVHGIADLESELYDWHNPVAAITIHRR